MDDLETPAHRRERHRRWLEKFGLSPEDWRRIKALTAEASPDYLPPALEDLSVPLRVAVCERETRRHLSGELLGILDGWALLAWRLNERERETWRRKRASRLATLHLAYSAQWVESRPRQNLC